MRKFFKLMSVTGMITLLGLLACDKDESEKKDCDVSNPIEELDWLKTMIGDMSEYDYMMTANYKDAVVFYNGNCDPVANYVSSVLNCNGEFIAYTNDIRDELFNDKLIWKHSNSKCDFK